MMKYNKIKVVIADMDGTLLNDKNQITEDTVKTIKEFQKQGGLFAVNTGRAMDTTLVILKEAGIDCDILSLSGGAIHDFKENCLMSDTMQDAEVTFIREIEHKYGLFAMYMTTKGVISEQTYEVARDHYLRQGHILAQETNREMTDDEIIKKHQWVLDIVDFEADVEKRVSEGELVYKMVLMGMNQEELEIAKKEINECPEVLALTTAPTTIEVNAARVNKGLSTMKYIELKGFLPEETMVIGDSGNDIPMFEIPVAKKIAMENAMDDLKALSTHITKSYNDDGIAYAIQKWVFEE